MMNIAIIVGCLYSGGAERIAGLLSKCLAQKYRVYLFLEFTDRIVYEYGGEIVDIGFAGMDYTEYYMELNKQKYSIDCSISFLDRYNFMNIRTKQTEKVIVSERNFLLFERPRAYYREMMVKHCYGNADAVVAISEGVNKELVTEFGLNKEDIHTIYNFFDSELICRKAEIYETNLIDESFYKEKKLIVNIGRLVDQKNQKRLLYQFADLHKKDPNTRLLIIGSGTLKNELQNIINELLLQDVVRICSYCENPFYLLKQASLFVFASRHEGWGNVLLEAMCLGVPIVAVDCMAGPREIIAGNANYEEYISEWIACDRGILVTPDESEDEGKTLYMSHAMQYCLENQEYSDSVRQAGLEYIRNYSNEDLLKQWIEVIEKTEIHNGLNRVKREHLVPKNIVYGAGKYGKKVIEQLLRENKEIFAVVVSETENNPSEICGIPVMGAEVLKQYGKDVNVYLGVSALYIDDVCHKILESGIAVENIITVKFIPN